MSIKDSKIVRQALRWRWVFAYTAFLLLSLGYARRIVVWLRMRDLSGLMGILLLGVGILGIVFVFRRVQQNQGRLTGSSLRRLLVFLAIYLCSVALSTSVTEERLHFIEYGILGILCFHAMDARCPIRRRAVYAVAVAFTIGFFDEVIQGFLAVRYYDIRDIAINGLAAGLPLAGLLWVPLIRADMLRQDTEPMFPGQGSSSSRFVIRDATVLLVMTGILCAMVWIGREKWDTGLLPGVWERENHCGVFERIRIREDRRILWEDGDGNRANGMYRVGGNRLDGPQLRVEVVEGSGSGKCGWKTETRRHYYFEVDDKRLVFKKRRNFPFRRVEINGTRPKGENPKGGVSEQSRGQTPRAPIAFRSWALQAVRAGSLHPGVFFRSWFIRLS